MRKTIKVEDAVARIPDGAVLMIGGFMGVGTPPRLIDETLRQGKKDLTIIANDTARPGVGIGKLIDAKRVKRVVASHIGTNPETQRQMLAGELEVELSPQGTLIERIRAGGHGLGGVLTATGLGTVVAEGKPTIEVDGRFFLLEKPLKADFAFIHAKQADYLGNLTYALTARNFNPVMAMAATVVLAEAQSIVPVGVIPPDAVMTPSVLVKHLILRSAAMDDKVLIAKRVALELKDGDLVNLGIGLPTLVAGYLPKDIEVFFQSENGIVGMLSLPEEGLEVEDLTDAGGKPIGALPGAATFDSAMSFGLIRGGHLDLTVLGGLQVDQAGRLANWMAPGRIVPGMGGAMDLVAGAKRVVVAMTHTAKGESKIVRECVFPLTSTRPVSLIVTELAVIAPTPHGLVLRERAPGVSVEAIVAATAAELIVPGYVPEMPI